MTGIVTHIGQHMNDDGGRSILVNYHGQQIEVVIPLAHLQDLVQTVQIDAILRAHETGRNMQIPKLTVSRIDVAHQGPDCELMVSTIQTGTVVLLMKDDQLRKMKSELDRVLSHRGASTAKH